MEKEYSRADLIKALMQYGDGKFSTVSEAINETPTLPNGKLDVEKIIETIDLFLGREPFSKLNECQKQEATQDMKQEDKKAS